MRKHKTKGLKLRAQPVPDRGPRYALALQGAPVSQSRTKQALLSVFEINDALAEVIVKSSPVVVLRDLALAEATAFKDRLSAAGDFRIWLESAATRMPRMRQMNLKPREPGEGS
jgi:hypothetical protein